MSASALTPFECTAERGLRRSEPRPQVEHVRQLEPTFLSGANVDSLRGFGELAEFPKTFAHPGFIANHPAVLPHQIAEGPL